MERRDFPAVLCFNDCQTHTGCILKWGAETHFWTYLDHLHHSKSPTAGLCHSSYITLLQVSCTILFSIQYRGWINIALAQDFDMNNKLEPLCLPLKGNQDTHLWVWSSSRQILRHYPSFAKLAWWGVFIFCCWSCRSLQDMTIRG